MDTFDFAFLCPSVRMFVSLARVLVCSFAFVCSFCRGSDFLCAFLFVRFVDYFFVHLFVCLFVRSFVWLFSALGCVRVLVCLFLGSFANMFVSALLCLFFVCLRVHLLVFCARVCLFLRPFARSFVCLFASPLVCFA